MDIAPEYVNTRDCNSLQPPLSLARLNIPVECVLTKRHPTGNVLEHAYAKDGAIVAAQYYKKTNRVSIGICDTGIGIWQSMHQSWQPKTDIDAIKLALTPGITGTTRREGGSSDNAGAGLFFIKSIAKITRNYFAIYSGCARYTLLKHPKRLKGIPRLYSDPTRDPHSETNTAPNYSGTLVAVDLSLDETPEFNVQKR